MSRILTPSARDELNRVGPSMATYCMNKQHLNQPKTLDANMHSMTQPSQPPTEAVEYRYVSLAFSSQAQQMEEPPGPGVPKSSLNPGHILFLPDIDVDEKTQPGSTEAFMELMLIR